MSIIDLTSDEQAIVQNELAAIFISLELSDRAGWLLRFRPARANVCPGYSWPLVI